MAEKEISKHLEKHPILQQNINQTYNIANLIMFQLLHVQIFIRLLNKAAILEIAKTSLRKHLKNAQFFDNSYEIILWMCLNILTKKNTVYQIKYRNEYLE